MRQLMILCCSLFTLAASVHARRIVKTPEALGCLNVRKGELKAREVVFADTATTVQFSLTYPAGSDFRIMSTCCLVDEEGRRYALRSAEGLRLDTYVQAPADGSADFTLHFEPMPQRTRVFDFVGDGSQSAFMLLGIHDRKYKLRLPTMEKLSAAYAWSLPADWFKTDTVTVRGRIEGYEEGASFPTSMEFYCNNVFEKDEVVLVADIAPDGTFEKKFLADYPEQWWLFLDEALPGMEGVAFFARPGETIDITLRKGDDGKYMCVYNSGSSKMAERWLTSKINFGGMVMPLAYFEGTTREAETMAEKLWSLMVYRLQKEAVRERFTPMDMQLALVNAQAHYAEAVLYHAFNRMFHLSGEMTEADSLERVALLGTEYYSRLLSRIDFDNPLLMSGSSFDILLNRMQFAWPLRVSDNEETQNVEGGDNAVSPVAYEKRQLDNRYVKLQGIMGCSKNTLMAQLCTYKELLSSYNVWRNNEKDKVRVLADTTKSEAERQKRAAAIAGVSNVMPLYLASFTYETVRRKAEEYHAYRQSHVEPATPLPEGQPAELIRSLQARYPGRYLVIDFWGMGCAPCRSAIEQSKQLRAEIAKRHDVKLVFIAGERTAEGSDAYKEYVKEWLADEETVCVTNKEFSRLQEYFRFNGIPHYEVITPDGRRVNDEYRIKGYYNFEEDMKVLIKEMN